MAQCLLDTFPVELIHHLLDYFSAHEIFNTFIDVSTYINDVLLVYSNYRANFKSVTKTEFDLVCQCIVPNQVISLTLCDSENTPGQVERFLSRFQINQFTRLRSLTLIDVGADFWESIMTKLTQLKSLRSFFYISSTRSDSWICEISGDDLNQLDTRLFDSYGPMLSQLNRLRLSHGDFLTTVQFPYLRHLILERCSANIIQYICGVAPQLKSLETKFYYDGSSTGFVFPLAQLNRLVLRISGSVVSMNDMERLMSNLPILKHLELHANGNVDLADGQRWQTVAHRLITFNFTFSLSTDLVYQDLHSYRTSFWLNEKHWFVACSYRTLFSVPHFATTMSDEHFQLPILSTAPDNSIFYERITKLSVSEVPVDIDHHFNHVDTLILFSPIHLSLIERTVDLSRIKNLILYSAVKNATIMSVIDQMENLYQISIQNEVKHFLEEMHHKPVENIRKLEIGNCYIDDNDSDNDYSIEELCSTFPRVEHLRVAHLCSVQQISSFISAFKYLSTASFYYTQWCFRETLAEENRTEIQSVLDQIRLHQKLDYTYRFDSSAVHIWI